MKFSPGATVSVDFEYEYAGDFASRYAEDNSYRPKNLVSVHTTHTVPGAADGERELQRKRRGAQVRVLTGYTTDPDVVDFDAGSEYLEATVTRVHDGTDVTNGKVVFNVLRSDGTQDSYLDPLNSNGRAKVSANLTDWESVYVQYLGSYPDAPSDIKEFHR